MTNTSTKSKKRLSDKYRGILSKQQGESLNKHIKQMREEWDCKTLSFRTQLSNLLAYGK